MAVMDGLERVAALDGVALLLIAGELLADEEGCSLAVTIKGVKDPTKEALTVSEDRVDGVNDREGEGVG